MNTNNTSEAWGGEAVSLHAKPKPSIIKKANSPKARSRLSADTVSDSVLIPVLVDKDNEATGGTPQSHSPASVDVLSASNPGGSDGDPGRGLSTPQASAPDKSQAAKNTQSSNIKQAFMDALASPIPVGVDSELVAHVEAARSVLGVHPIQSQMTNNSAYPPTFANSSDMKDAFTKALESPAPQSQMMQYTLSDLPPAHTGQKSHAGSQPVISDSSVSSTILGKLKKPRFAKIDHSESKHSNQKLSPALITRPEDMLVTASPVIVNPSGEQITNVDRRTRRITKFAAKSQLAPGGWTANSEQDTPITDQGATIAETNKPFTIDETTTPRGQTS